VGLEVAQAESETMSKRDEDLMRIGDQAGHGLGRVWTVIVYGVLGAMLLGVAGAVVLVVVAVGSC
jgi:hypothetical protein